MLLKWVLGKGDAASAGAARLERARALRLRDDFVGASAAAQEVLREEPDNAAALALMAAIAADQRQVQAGLQWARRALDADPRCVPAHFATGRLLEAAERYAEAEASYRRVTELDPGNAQAFTNLGCMLHLQQRIEDAVSCYRRALQLQPGQPVALRNYALVAGGAEEVAEALEGFERHVTAHPADADAQLQLGHLYQQTGRHEESLAAYERAIALDVGRPEFHFARAQCLLLLGRYEEGWKEYEWRWRMALLNEAVLRFPQPRWDGKPLARGTLLLHGEAAFGDNLQLVRYATLAAQRCARVIVECPPALHALVAGVPGVAQAVPQGAPLPHFDVQLPLIACPGVFGTTIRSVPWMGPYIPTDTARVRLWGERVRAAAPRCLKVGAVWTGNAGNLGNRDRSLTLERLRVLAEVPETTVFSLQKGVPVPQHGEVPEGMHFVDLTAQIGDFADTAALLTQLDVVVSVDTAVAHLAGALDRPVWVLLPFSADWRYHTGREDNPWYPSMRQFRQHAPGVWDDALQNLKQALLALAGY